MRPIFPPGLSTSTRQRGGKYTLLSQWVNSLECFQHSEVFSHEMWSISWCSEWWAGHGPNGCYILLWWLTRNLTLISEFEGIGEWFHPKNFLGESSWLHSQSGVMNYMFKLWDAVTRAKRQEDVTVDSSGTVVTSDILRQDIPPEVRILSLQCLETVISLRKPYNSVSSQYLAQWMTIESLQSPPRVDLQAESDELVLSVLVESKHEDCVHIAGEWRWE